MRPSAAVRVAVLVAILALGTAFRAFAAGTVAEELDEARRLINVELRFKDAIEHLERALADPHIKRDERIEAYRLLGIGYVARGAPESAESAFAALLALEPGFVLDAMLSPKIHAVFDRVKARVGHAPQIVEVTASRDEGAVVVSARLDDPEERVAGVFLFTRRGGGAFEELAMERDGDRVSARIAADQTLQETLRIEYYLVGRTREGAAVARASDEQSPSVAVFAAPEREPGAARTQPLVVPAERPTIEEESPWYATWWVWAIAIGVIGAGTATAVVLTRGDHAAPVGTLDPIMLK